MHTRRQFLKQSAMGLGILAGFNSIQCSRQKSRPKNVLFVICDDLNDSLEGWGGHNQTITPNINRLMQRSTRFMNAHSNDPICGPSRASLLTGIYPHKSGYFGYKQQQNHWRKNPVLKDAKTFMEHFSENGYDVYGTGKIFHNGHEDWSVWKKENGFGIEPTFGPVAWDGSYKNGKHDHALGLAIPSLFDAYPEVGKQRWYESFGSLADVPDYPPEPEKGIPGYKGWICFGKPFHYESEEDRDLMPDELNAEWASEILSQDHANPFMLMVGMNRPHSCWHAPQKYFDLFPLDSIQLPDYLENDLDDCAEILKPPEPDFNAAGYNKYNLIMKCGGEKNWKRWVQAYLACVAFVDDQIGKILKALEKSPHAHDTMIVLVSDHGYHMGEKEYIFKNTLWEESSRVPLLISTPGMKKPGICDHPVSLIDLYPTLIDLCRLPDNPNQSESQ